MVALAYLIVAAFLYACGRSDGSAPARATDVTVPEAHRRSDGVDWETCTSTRCAGAVASRSRRSGAPAWRASSRIAAGMAAVLDAVDLGDTLDLDAV